MNFAHRTIAFLALVSLAACAADSVNTPEGELQPRGTKLQPMGTSHHVEYSASVYPVDSLTVSIAGKGIVQTPSTQTYRATVSNGTATHYHYQWFTTDCLNNCSTMPMNLYAEGDDMSSLAIQFVSTNDEKIITVHVTELNGTGKAGSTRDEVEGPDMFNQGLSGTIDNPCDLYNDIFYPLTGTYTDPVTGQSRQRNFRRNYCDNSITWDPNG